MSLLKIENLSKSYSANGNDFHALKDVSLEVLEGQCVGIIGESGSGKSTIVNIVAGFISANSGTVEYDGFVLTDKRCSRNARNTMQMIFQSAYGSFSPKMKLGVGIREGIRYSTKLSAKEQEDRIDSIMERVGLPLSYKDKYVFEVSGGEAQRAAIARAILINPKLLICDECTSALDASVQDNLIELLLELKNEMNMSILFISHDITLVKNFCDTIYVLHNGEVVESGTTDEIFNSPKTEYTKCLIEAGSL